MVQVKARRRLVRVDIEMVDAAGVERRRAPLQAMHLIAAAEQEFGEIGAVLAGGAGDQGDLARHRPGGASDVEGLAAAAAAFLVRIAEDEARPKLVLHKVHPTGKAP